MKDTSRPATNDAATSDTAPRIDTDTDADAESAAAASRNLALLDQFTPVPRHWNRHDGWTPERQRGFIAALAETGSVKAAALAVNMASEGAYQLRRHPEAGEFRAAWEAALSLGVQRLEDVALERALNGVPVPIYHFGKPVGERRVYNDRLLMFLLRNRRANRFAADRVARPDASTAGELRRLKAKWRKEWEREHAMEEADDGKALGGDLIEELERRHLHWWSMLGPRARAAYRAFRRLEQQDLGHAPKTDEECDAIIAEYDEVFAEDGRAQVDRLIEAEAIGDDKLPPEDAEEARAAAGSDDAAAPEETATATTPAPEDEAAARPDHAGEPGEAGEPEATDPFHMPLARQMDETGRRMQYNPHRYNDGRATRIW